MPDVPLEGHLVGRHEDLLDVLRDAGQVVDDAPLRDLLHEGVRVEPALPGDFGEDRVGERQDPVPDLVGERDREGRLDPGRASGDHRDRARGGDGRDRRVAERPPVLVDGPRPVRERPPLLGELRRLVVRLLVDERHDPVPEVQGRLAVVGNAHPEEEIGPPHDAEPDPAVGLHGLVDLRKRIRVDLDDVVEESDRQPDDALELGPVDRPLPVGLPPGERRDVDGAQVAGLVRQERLLPARIGGLHQPDLGRRVGGTRVDAVEEDHAGVARSATPPGRSGRRLRGRPAG